MADQDQSQEPSSLAPRKDSEARIRAHVRKILRNLVRAIAEKARRPCERSEAIQSNTRNVSALALDGLRSRSQ